MVPMKNILVPTDFSEPANAALDYARALAAEFGSRLHLLHVVPEPMAYPWGTELSTFSLANILGESQTGALERLQAVGRRLGLASGRVEACATVGRPTDRILEYINQHDIDLVVMGSHGRGMVEHLLIGSVAERIVRRSPVPVVTLHGAPRVRTHASDVAAAGVAT